MNLLNPNEIIQLFSTKNHFKWSFSLWFFGQRSSLLYHGLVWFCLISQFSDPKIVCQSNIPQDYEIAQWYCLFKQTKIVQDDVEDSMQRFQLPYRINQIYACLLPTLIMMLFCLELPDFIRKHLSDCPQLQSLIDQIESLTSQHCWNDSSKIIWKNYLNIFDNRKRNNLCIIIVSMHFGSLLSLIFISALFFLAFNFDHSVLTYGFDYFVYYYNQYVNNQQIDHPKTKLFPTVIKCAYPYFGPSGNLQKADLICFIKLNFLLEKIILIVWIHLFISIILILYDCTVLLLFLLPSYRKRFIQHHTSSSYCRKQDSIKQDFLLDYSDVIYLNLLRTNIGHWDTSKFLEKLLRWKQTLMKEI